MSSNPSLQGSGIYVEEEAKIVRAKVIDDSEETLSFIHNRSETHKFTEPVTACIRPEKVQTRHDPSTEKGSEHKIPPLTKKLSVTDTCWERKYTTEYSGVYQPHPRPGQE